jgi:hypothetical protein
MSYIRKIVSLIAATVLAVGLVGVAQTAAQAAGAATFTVNDGTNAIEGAFVSVVTKDAAGIDTDGDSTADVTSGGTVAGGTTDENGQFVAKLEDGTDLPDGNYAYSVAKPGFGVKVGGFTITGSALSRMRNRVSFMQPPQVFLRSTAQLIAPETGRRLSLTVMRRPNQPAMMVLKVWTIRSLRISSPPRVIQAKWRPR